MACLSQHENNCLFQRYHNGIPNTEMNQQLTITADGAKLNFILNDTDTTYLSQHRCSYFKREYETIPISTLVFPIQVSPKIKFTLTNLPKMFKTRILFRLHTSEVECCNGKAKNISAQSIGSLMYNVYFDHIGIVFSVKFVNTVMHLVFFCKVIKFKRGL